MNSKFYWLIVVLILASIATGACTAPPTPASTLAPQPTPTGPGGFPLGNFKPDHLLYTQYILFTAQGTVVLGLGDADTGSYVVSGDQIVFSMDVGICHNHPGTYHWEIHGDTLTLRPINETCTESARAEDLGGRSWIRQP
jgi:hypothetical protein